MSDFFGFGSFKDLLANGEKRWKAIKDMAVMLIHSKGAEPNIDPAKRANLEELTHIAQLKISELIRQDLSAVKLTPVTRAEFAKDIVESYKPFFEVLEVFSSDGMQIEISGDVSPEMMGEMFGGEMPDMSSFAPLLTVFIISTGVGNLSLEAMSSYELIAPRTTEQKEILFVMNNIDDFIKEWSLSEKDFLMWMCLAQLSMHYVISIPHIQNELVSLIEQFTRSFEPSSGESLRRLGEGLESADITLDDINIDEQPLEDIPAEDISLEDISLDDQPETEQGVGFLESKLMNMVSNEPEILLGAQISEVQESISEQLSAIVAVIRGVSQLILDHATKSMFGSGAEIRNIKEAFLRKQSVPSQAINMISRLLGIDMSAELRELGTDFVAGLVEGGGYDAIPVLMKSVENLPTPTELGIPELWLARMNIETKKS